MNSTAIRTAKVFYFVEGRRSSSEPFAPLTRREYVSRDTALSVAQALRDFAESQGLSLETRLNERV